MKLNFVTIVIALFVCGCTSTPATTLDPASEVAALQSQLNKLQEEKNLLDLKLQDEIERGTIQVFLMRQEIAAARREVAAMRTKCGAACADSSTQQ